MPAKETTTLTSKQVMARLDNYLPELNTGLMDVRVQDAVIKYPLVRALMVPDCDLEARRRCIRLVSRILESVGPVLPLILQYQSVSQLQRCGSQCEKAHPEMKAAIDSLVVPPMSQEAQAKVLNSLSELSEKDSIIRYWLNHHRNSLQQSADPAKRFVKVGTGSVHVPRRSKGILGGSNPVSTQPTASLTAATTPTGRKRNSSVIKQHQEAAKASEIELNPTVALYLKVKITKDILTDLGDRVQGAVCQVFWECWDESFMTLADIVGIEALCEADAGRLFRPQGDAALYISNFRATKKRKVEESRRLSTFTPAPVVLPTHDIVDDNSNAAFNLSAINMNMTSVTIPNSIPTAFPTIPSAPSLGSITSSGSPEALSPLSPQHNKRGAGSPSSDVLMTTDQSMSTTFAKVELDASLPLVDTNDLNYILSGIYNEQKTADGVGAYITLQDEIKQANLRQRIHMMEQGSLLDDEVDSKSIVW
jgi:hypothetical protein